MKKSYPFARVICWLIIKDFPKKLNTFGDDAKVLMASPKQAANNKNWYLVAAYARTICTDSRPHNTENLFAHGQ